MKPTPIRRPARAIAALVAAAATAIAAVAGAAVYRVAPDAADTGSGESWSDAATLANALSAAADGDTILMKSGVYRPSASVAVTKAVSIEGGYAGVDDTTLADSPMSVIDDAATNLTQVVTVSASASGKTTRLLRLVISNGLGRGIAKTGAADLLVEGCQLVSNGVNTVSGVESKACYVNAGGATVTFRDTVFRGNRQEKNCNMSGGDKQAALYVYSAKEVVVENCGFFANGSKLTAGVDGMGSGNSIYDKFSQGSAIYTQAKTTVSGCRFSGNSVAIRGTSVSGGTVWFASGSSGSVVSNCLFVGNFDRPTWSSDSANQGGAVVMNLGSLDQTLSVVGCTIAYNLANGRHCAAGITAVTGTLDVDGCVFFGNMVSRYANESGLRDISVKRNARARVRNSAFGDAGDLFSVEDPALGGGITFDDGVVFSDPMLVTRPDEFNALVKETAVSGNQWRHFGQDDAVHAQLEALDAHLLSAVGYRTNGDATFRAAAVHSPAIDLAAADADVGSEGAPNGGRRNAGFYGGTAEASLSALNAPTLTADDIAVTFDDETHPTATATLRGEEGKPFNAFLDIAVFAEDPSADGASAVPVESKSFAGVQAGGSGTLSCTRLYASGSTLYVRATATVPGLEPVTAVKAVKVTGTAPAYVGHGGGAGVIHVRGGAAEKCDGSNWADAFPTLEEALALAAADSSKTEIWIAGTILSTGQVAKAFAPAAESLTVRGGFAGTEDALDARPAEGLSYVDGRHLYNQCILANAEGHKVTVERVVFMNAVMNGIVKTGGGDLEVRDCQFLTNGVASASLSSWTGKDIPGRGIRVASASGATVVVSNCLFSLNCQTNKNNSLGRSSGPAVSFEGCAGASVIDSLFVANGINLQFTTKSDFKSGNSVGDVAFKGSAVYAAVPTTIVGTRFFANVSNVRYNWEGGGTVWFANGSSGSVVSNCLFKGNCDRGCWDTSGRYAGAIVVNMGAKAHTLTVTGSTFAYNLADASYSAAGMTVRKGTVELSNCVFGGSFIPENALIPSTDLRVGADGVVNASYTVFGDEASRAVHAEDGGTFTAGEGLVYSDPLFVTTPDEVAALRAVDGGYTTFAAAKRDAVLAIDAHLRSKEGYVTDADPTTWLKADASSPAIDAGTGDYSNEPDFNGNRRNAGFYGNTAEASKTFKSATPVTFTASR